jgi:hypothetical protein
VLLLLRAAWVEQGGTWGIPGGGIGEGFYRTPVQPITDMRVFLEKAKEEVEEECGSLPPGVRSLRADLPFTEYEDCGFRYVTFILDITRAQKAAWAPFSADGENDAFVWFPLDAVKKGRPLPDEDGDEHDIHFGVTFTMGKLPRANPRPTTAERTDPALWEAVKREVTAGSKGGVAGEWSARKAQLSVALYKQRGGGYLGPKSPTNSLVKWTREDWRTRSGKPSLVTGERYLPARAIEALTPAEYAATTRAKRAGLLRDEQFTPQPERIAAKTARYRRNPEYVPTAQYDALAASLRREYVTFTDRLRENRTLGLYDLLAEWADANCIGYLGSGWHRKVFRVPEGALKIRLQHIDRDRQDGNLSEARVWREAPPTIRKHLVPVLAVAEDGTWLLQEYAPSTGRPQTAKEEKRVDARLKALSRCGFNWREISGDNAADDGRVLDYASVQDDARWQKCVEKAAAKKANPARRAGDKRYRKNPSAYKKDLIQTLLVHGAKVYTYDTLPAPAKAAATEYLDEPHEDNYLVGELPTEYVKQRVMAEFVGPFRWLSFDAYHRWYVEDREKDGRMPNYPKANRWPSLLAGTDKDGFIWDGWHRFHAYIRAGHPTVPVYMILREGDVPRVNPARRAGDKGYRRNPSPREAEALRAIRANLTPDLLAGEYRACAATHPLAGHCSVATEALYFMLGGKAAGYTPMNVRHPVKGNARGVSHWYLRTPDNRYLDPTADQFDTPVDYASGRGRGFPTPRQGHAEPPPSKRAATLLQRLGARKR